MTIEIIHLKQFHKIPGIPNYDEQNEICNTVAKSQFKLANYLAHNNNTPVVLESLYDNINCENSSEMCAVTKEVVFPDGLPNSFEDLSYAQKVMLYEYGATITLTYMGVLPQTYPSIDSDSSDKIDAEARKLSYEELYLKVTTTEDFGNREHFALDNAKLAAQDHYGSSTQGKVFIVFGAAHDFRKECIEFGYQHSEIDFSPDKDTISFGSLITTQRSGSLITNQLTQSKHVNNEGTISPALLITEDYKDSIFSEQLKILSTNHPGSINQLIQSKHVNIKELSDFAKNHFETLQNVILTTGLIDFIASGVLPLEQLSDVFYDKEHKQHLWGIVKDSLLNHDISFDQLLSMPNDKMNSMHHFETTQELASYVTNIVGDMDHVICLWTE